MTHALTLWLAADPCPAVTETDWLTAPRATVIAAAIAIIGAVVAFLGVTVTTRTTRSENRRAEKVAVLTDAWAAVFKLSRALEVLNKTSDPIKRSEKIKAGAVQVSELGEEHAFTASKLPLYNFGVALSALVKLNAELLALWDTMRKDPTTGVDDSKATNAYTTAETAIKDAIRGLN